MAEQSTSQQKDQQMVNIILANVGTVVYFRTGNPQDERILLPLFNPYINEGGISNLPSYNFYAKLSAIHAQEPVSGQTLLLPHNGSEAVALKVIASSRSLFATKQISSSAEQEKDAGVIDKTNVSKKQSSESVQKKSPDQPIQDKSDSSKLKPPGY